MLDCHIIVANDTPEAWLAQCLDSVQAAIHSAGYPVELHLVPFVPGHIGHARAAGYARGSYPYVTCIDDDDYLLPHAFAQLHEPMTQGAVAVCTPELTLQNGVLKPGRVRHHLIAYRRERLIDHRDWTCCGDVAQLRSVADEAVELALPAYVHRLYGASKARQLRRAQPAELERACA